MTEVYCGGAPRGSHSNLLRDNCESIGPELPKYTRTVVRHMIGTRPDLVLREDSRTSRTRSLK